MKRAGNLWDDLVSVRSLFMAAERAAAGKLKRPDVAKFRMNLEPEVLRLRRELIDGSYRPGEYRTFTVLEPKPRLISAAPFRDRVAHHALTQALEPIFERRFASNSFACRKGFGTHRALEAARVAARRYPYVLKCDIRKYFPSIDHQILKALLARVIKCERTLELASWIINGSNDQEEVILYFDGDDLFTPYERRRGLPLGNQTSQFFANVYLNPLDHFVNRQLRPGLYARYVDDFLLFGEDKQEMNDHKHAITEFLAGLRLTMHPGKTRVYRVADGVTFLGWRLFPAYQRLVRGNVIRFRRRLRSMQSLYARNRAGWDYIKPRVQAWIAHAEHGSTWRLREQVFEQYSFQKWNAA